MFFQQTFRLFTPGVAVFLSMAAQYSSRWLRSIPLDGCAVFLSMAAQGSPTPFRGIAFSPLDGEFALFDDIYSPIDVENVNPK